MLCKLMGPSESCLATQTAQCQWNVNFSVARYFPARYFPANKVPAILFQLTAFSEASLPSLIYFVKLLSIKVDQEKSTEVQTRIAGAVSHDVTYCSFNGKGGLWVM